MAGGRLALAGFGAIQPASVPPAYHARAPPSAHPPTSMMGLRRLLRGGGLWRHPRVQTSRPLPHALLGICGGATGLYLSTAAPLLAASQPDDPPEEALFSPSRPYPLWDLKGGLTAITEISLDFAKTNNVLG